MNDWDCVDCGANTRELGEYYMVLRSIWLQAGMRGPSDQDIADLRAGKYDGATYEKVRDLLAAPGMLCIGCLENRIGRKLTRYDFMDAPINDLGYFPADRSDRLIDRLTTLTI